MTVSYIDCSPFIMEFLREMIADKQAAISVNVGDPDADAVVRLATGRPVIMNGHTYMDDDLLARLPDLRRIVFLGSGASSYIDLQAASRRDIEILTVGGYGDRSVAEHATALMFAAARQVARMDRDLRKNRWQPLAGIELAGRTLGVVGFGGIGRAMADIGRALGMRIMIFNRSPIGEDWSHCQTHLENLLSQSDVVSLHLALTPETLGFIGEGELASLKAGAILINTARAGLVDERALIAALDARQLDHVALDVFNTEPLVDDSPLLGRDDVTLTAHAGFKTLEASKRLIATGLSLAFNPLL